MEEAVSPHMTLQDIALMIANQGRQISALDEKFSEKIDTLSNTVDTLAMMTKKEFARQQAAFEALKQETAENFVTVRRDIMATGDRFPSQYAFDRLANRVMLLEDIVLPAPDSDQ